MTISNDMPGGHAGLAQSLRRFGRWPAGHDGSEVHTGLLAQDRSTEAWLYTALETVAIIAASAISGAIVLAATPAWHGAWLTGAGILLANGVLVSALFCGLMRLIETQQGPYAADGSGQWWELCAVWLAAFWPLAVTWHILAPAPALTLPLLGSFFVCGFVAVFAARGSAPALLLKRQPQTGVTGHPIILAGAGTSDSLNRIARRLRRNGHSDIASVSIDAGCAEAEWPQTLTNALYRIAASASMAGTGTAGGCEILLAVDGFPRARLAALQHGLEALPLPARLVPGREAVDAETPAALTPTQRRLKRTIDLIIATALLILAAPTMCAIALWVILDSRGPIFFRQQRLGYRGKPFTILKFRTRQEPGNDTDELVTRAGQMLRRQNLDALPQLFNVIAGEMSLVGPRPHTVAHDHFFSGLIGNYERRQSIMPGVTGWAQIHGLRGEATTVAAMRKQVAFDLWYAHNASLRLDLKILARAAIMALRQNHAG
ncbi:MAG: sugar transferase [Alphaproteobacteria bacterium]|nr:sugar transferase [Alphaproteobacteria bacterium]